MFGCWWSVRSVCLPSPLLFAVRVQRGREAELQEAHNTEGQWGVHAGGDCELWWESQTSMCHFNCVHFNSNHFMPLVFFIHVDTLVNLLRLYVIDITILSHLSSVTLYPWQSTTYQSADDLIQSLAHQYSDQGVTLSPLFGGRLNPPCHTQYICRRCASSSNLCSTNPCLLCSLKWELVIFTIYQLLISSRVQCCTATSCEYTGICS